MHRTAIASTLWIVFLAPAPALARGGGGCLEEGTSVLTPSGPVPVERLAVGDALLAVIDGALRPSTVRSVLRVEPAEYLEMAFEGGLVRLTPDHPVADGPGAFRTAGGFRPGDDVLVFASGALRATPLLAIRRIPASRPAYNLLVHPGGTFLAGGLVVHNKGCFLPDTEVLRADGRTAPIRDVRPGDALRAYLPDGTPTTAAVLRVLTHEVDAYAVVALDGVVLRVTEEHPFFVGDGAFRALESLRVGDRVYAWDGRALRLQRILAINRVRARTTVYNLQTDSPHTFFANGIAVHNKGCFPAGTPVRTPTGERPIEALAPGDAVLGLDASGRIVETRVAAVFLARSPLLAIETDAGILRVTPDHPMGVPGGSFRAAGDVGRGNALLAWNGGRTAPVAVRDRRPEPGFHAVTNLQVGPPHTYFAAGFLAHNKGGCFPAGTRVATPSGERPIDALSPGDPVWAVAKDGLARPVPVTRLHATLAALLTIETDGGTLRTTADHPLLDADGRFRPAGVLVAGDRIVRAEHGPPRPATILAIRPEDDAVPVFNLGVAAPHTFLADGFAVHNKGGFCVAAGTPVRTPRGEVPIESLAPGDRVEAVTEDGKLANVPVLASRIAVADVLSVETGAGTIRVSAEHPLRLASGEFLDAAQLVPGDRVAAWRSGRPQPVRVLAVRDGGRDQWVCDLQVGAPHTFVAGGLVVHNKGGGSRSGGSGRPMTPAEAKIVFVVFGAIVLVVIVAALAGRKRNRAREDLDYLFRASAIDAKSAKTRKLLAFIARTDPLWTPDALHQTARETFLKLQACWQARDYEPMRPLLMPDLHAQHLRQIRGMIRNHEINVMGHLAVERIDVVHVRYTDREDRREFTALVTARARDHYVDDRTGKVLRGDTHPARFQEFWVFQRHGGVWRLREIEQTRESDALKDENFFEPFTDEKLKAVYAETASPGGPAGPWLEKESETKENRVERLLAFLVQTDPLWDRRKMLDRARAVFLEVLLAREAGDPAGVPVASLFPDVAASLAEEMRHRSAARTTVEYRNLCVRKVELALVRNVADRSRDEFTARIRAHAQVVVRRDGTPVRQDADVTPFEEFWTFGRLDDAWKLKEVQPPAKGQTMVGEENVDEDSSVDQLQWYYTKPRAV